MKVIRLRTLLLTALLGMSFFTVQAQNILLNCDTVRIESNTLPDSSLTFTINGINFKMIYVEGGSFMMGATKEQEEDACDIEMPVHSVTLSSYYLCETEVTQALWKAVMGTTVVQQRAMNNARQMLRGEGPEIPMYYVTWDDCQAFISKLNALSGRHFRLPTEAEWEFAARGGNKSKGYKYSGSDDYNNVCWCDENSGNKAHPVKTKMPNELGFYDMSGGVWEMCQDWHGMYSSSDQINPQGPNSDTHRVERGGSWRYVAWHCRVSYRGGYRPGDCSSVLGFRIAM